MNTPSELQSLRFLFQHQPVDEEAEEERRLIVGDMKLDIQDADAVGEETASAGNHEPAPAGMQ